MYLSEISSWPPSSLGCGGQLTLIYIYIYIYHIYIYNIYNKYIYKYYIYISSYQANKQQVVNVSLSIRLSMCISLYIYTINKHCIILYYIIYYTSHHIYIYIHTIYIIIYIYIYIYNIYIIYIHIYIYIYNNNAYNTCTHVAVIILAQELLVCQPSPPLMVLSLQNIILI